MQPVEFSFFLPVKNGGSYIKSCIQSILSQTYHNFNLIVLENCSTDGTAEWLKNLEDSRIIVYESDRPLTIEENWKRILTTDKSEFIVLTGHDDLFSPNYLETIIQLIETHPLASIYTTHFDLINASGKKIRICKPIDEIQNGHEFLASLLTNQTDLMGTGFTMRSKDYNQVGGIPYFYPNLLFADLVLFVEIANLTYKATAIESCFSFRIHQSTTTTSADLKFQEAFKKTIYYLADIKEKSVALKKVIERYGHDFILFYCKGLAHRMMRTSKKSTTKQSVRQFIEDCNAYGKLLSPHQPFDVNRILSIKLAKLIDGNIISRFLFVLFKKIYKKPVL